MSEIATITNIREHKDTIKEKIASIDVKQFEGQTFGNEGEYTYQELLDDLDSLLTDITTLTKVPKQFVKISTYEERKNINYCLSNINALIPDPHSLWEYLEQLKQYIRPFHIRYTKERLLDFDAELSELTKKKTTLSRQLTDTNSKLSQTIRNKEKSDTILNDLTKQRQQLPQLEQDINTINNNVARIEKVKNNADNYRTTIDNFVKKITEREIQLENQNAEIKQFNEKLAEFTKERAKLLQTAEELIEKSKTALGYTETQSISTAFKTQLDKVENKGSRFWKNASFWWIVSAITFVSIGIVLTIVFILINQSTDFSVTLARLSLMALPLAGTWFCAGQYTKLKNIAEDYAYKTVLAQSIIGFSEQLKNDDPDDKSYQDYMKKMLDEIHQHPIPKHKRDDIDRSLLERITKVVKEKAGKSSTQDKS